MHEVCVVVFGEVLVDRFPDGSEVIGGAPFNLAWHLQGVGLRPIFVSRVGDDEAGHQIRERMSTWGMDTSHLQTDPSRPTGRVEVSVHQGHPHYDIVAPAAYDAIEWPDLPARSHPTWLVHGTLAARASRSAATLRRLVDAAHHRLVDVNLRAPWFDGAAARPWCRGADLLKVSADELHELSGGAGPRALIDELALGSLVVTAGSEGASLTTPGQPATVVEGTPTPDVVDTVGAGDAFSALLLWGRLQGWPAERTLRTADRFARRVIRRRGATSSDPTLYEGLA
jgi:fructokinase